MTTSVPAGIYTRISLATQDDTTKTDDQERICRDLAARLGWEVTEVYCDSSKSAWQVGRKRPAWDRMITDITDGRITAIVVYHGDRLLRTHEDLLTLIHLARTRDLKMAGPTGTRDLGNYDDQFILEIEASMAKRESANISRRRKAQYDRMRRQGRTRPGGGGGRCFGFEKDGITHRPDEARAIGDIAAMVISGESIAAAARELEARGLSSTKGKRVSVNGVRRILTWPRMAALMPDGVSAAAWQPVLDRSTWEAVQAILALNSALPNAGRGALHLLSGIARCGRCGHVMWAARKGATSYKCPKCALSRNMEHLDAYVTARTMTRLANAANPAGQIPEAPGLAAEFAALTQARRELEAVIADHSRGHLPVLLARLDSLDARLRQLRDAAGDDARNRLLAAHSGITEEGFAALPLPVRRSLVVACFTIVVLPASKRGPGFSTGDVVLTPR